MSEHQGIDPLRIATPNQIPRRYSKQIKEQQALHSEIKKICEKLTTSTTGFVSADNANAISDTYDLIEAYVRKYDRWRYSDISDYLFNCSQEQVTTFLTNVETVDYYIHARYDECPKTIDSEEKQHLAKMMTRIDKLLDHANLAQKQNENIHSREQSFDAMFEKKIIPFESKFSKEMYGQFISLISIFTALSFLIFGGISSLDNIFDQAVSLPILQLIIIGCIWSLCISNLVFVFIFFVSKLTKTSIKSSDSDNASVSEKYPFVIWCNYVLLLILVLACLIYYIDYSNSGGWILSLSRSHEFLFFIISLIIVIGVFSVIAVFLCKKGKKKK